LGGCLIPEHDYGYWIAWWRRYQDESIPHPIYSSSWLIWIEIPPVARANHLQLDENHFAGSCPDEGAARPRNEIGNRWKDSGNLCGLSGARAAGNANRFGQDIVAAGLRTRRVNSSAESLGPG